jgi:glycerol uptake facilitator-like aquaporin
MTEFGIKTSHYIIGAVSLVTALSWNTAIRESLNVLKPISRKETIANFVYAFIITIILVMIIWFLPSTTSELPKSTQEKINELNSHEKLLQRVTRLELIEAMRNIRV